MSEKARKTRVKDLDPKDRAKNVKGGVWCIVFGTAGRAGRAVEDVLESKDSPPAFRIRP